MNKRQMPPGLREFADANVLGDEITKELEDCWHTIRGQRPQTQAEWMQFWGIVKQLIEEDEASQMNTAHFDPFDGDANPEFGPKCCGEEMGWVDCAECEGTGIAEYEDGGMELCGDCNGEGGDYGCANCGATGLDVRVHHELNQREE